METQDTNGDKFHKIVTINRTKLRAFIDFGSSCTTIKISTVISISLEYNPTTRVRITGYGNYQTISLGVTSLFELTVEDVSAEVVAYCNQEEELLVGKNFTELSHIHVSKGLEADNAAKPHYSTC